MESVAENASTFNIATPINFNNIEDHSYAVVERLSAIDEYSVVERRDSNGNTVYTETEVDADGNPVWTGRKVLSAVGYDYRFPYRNSELSKQANSVGWFNSWGSNSGTTTYNLGNSWTFTVTSALEYTDMSDYNAVYQTASGKCGLNADNEAVFLKRRPDSNGNTDGFLFLRNNNAIFEYLFQGPQYPYFRVSKLTNAADGLSVGDATDSDNYWFRIPTVLNVSYYWNLYAPGSAHAKEKDEQARANGMGGYPALSPSNRIYYTPSQLETDLGIDLNRPWTLRKTDYSYEWRIYGSYWRNNVRKFMECDPALQENINAVLSSQPVKMNYESFRLMIARATQLSSDMIYDNVEWANLVLVKVGPDGEEVGPEGRFLIADTVLIPIGMGADGSYLPGAVDAAHASDGGFVAGDIVTLSTPAVMSKPEFLIDNMFLVDFPCYRLFGNTIRNVSQTNFEYSKTRNATSFDMVVEGLVPHDLTVDCATGECRLLSKRTVHFVPPALDGAGVVDGHVVDVTELATDRIPVSNGVPTDSTHGLYLRPGVSLSTAAGTTFGNNDRLTLGSRYPMTPTGAVNFPVRTVFRLEVDGDSIDHYFDIRSESLPDDIGVLVRYNGLLARTSTEKLGNTVVRNVNGVELQPYMYDATKLRIDYRLTGGKEIALSNKDVSITVNDNTGEGKNVLGANLLDIVNGKFADFVFTTGLARNEVAGCYELILFIAAKCDAGPFAGKGFNDSTVLVEFDIADEYRKTYNLRDVEYNVSYITTLPPYLIQGTPFTRSPNQEVVLNSGIEPANSAARVDYAYGPYADNTLGYKSDILFTNGTPQYVCVASALLPGNSNTSLTSVGCSLYDAWTDCRRPIQWTSADNGVREFTVLTSGDAMGYAAPTATLSATANIGLWTFEQSLDLPDVRAAGGVVGNVAEISAHLDYTTTHANLEQRNMVVVRAN